MSYFIEPGTVTAIDTGADYKSFPTVIECHNGDLLTAYRANANVHTLVGATTVKTRRSTTSGASWAAAITQVSGTAGRDLREGLLLRLQATNEILLCYTDAPSGGHSSSNKVTVKISDDDGVTFAASSVDITYSGQADNYGIVACQPYQLANGDILIALQVKNVADTNPNCEVYKSTNGGVTFSHLSQLADGDAESKNWAEPSLVQLTDGTVVAFIRSLADESTWYKTSANSGSTWSAASLAFTKGGAAPRVNLTAEGTLCIFSRIDSNAAGISVPVIAYADESDLTAWKKFQYRYTAITDTLSNYLNYGSMCQKSDGSIHAVWSEGQSSTDSDLYHSTFVYGENSYNRIFGLGTHSEHANLKGSWLMQDNAANTTVDDSSALNKDGTLTGAGNTSASSVAGPNSYLTAALSFDGSNDYVASVGAVADYSFVQNTGKFELSIWVKVGSTTGRYALFGNTASTTEKGIFVTYENGAGAGTKAFSFGVFRGTASTFVANIRTQDTVINDTDWHHLFIKCDGYADQAEIWVDNVKATNTVANSHTGLSSGDSSRVMSIATTTWSTVPLLPFSGSLAGVALITGYVDAKDEIYLGPEPINTAAPALSGTEEVGAVLTCSTGTWALDVPFSGGSNGSLSYHYDWQTSPNGTTGWTSLGAADQNTYTLTAGEQGEYIKCVVTASNAGGFDPAELASSDVTGAIAAASGGSFKPYFIHRSSSIGCGV